VSEETTDVLSGTDKASVLLLSLGEEAAAAVLKHLGPKEVQRIGSSMAKMTNVSSDQVGTVLTQFLESIGSHTALGVDSENYIRETLIKALGEDKAGGLMDRILLGGNAEGLETLKWMDARAIADMIRNEHPQIIAIILSYLDSDQAADILGHFSERQRPDLLLRIATLDTVQPSALNELNAVIEKQVSGSASVQSSAMGGVKAAADILNYVDSTIEQSVMEQLRDADEELSQEIEDLMFVFENLNEVDDTAIQAILREVSTEVLLLALKGADEALQEKVFRNMSKRAAEMLRDDLESKGPVKLSEVEGAQKEILGVARRMAEEGTISLGGAGGEEMI
jgi:flagellar motor switch protein FliG